MHRRRFLKAGALLAAMSVPGLTSAAQSNGRGARIVIAGAGAAGLSLAARFARQLNNASITIVDAKKEHHFQPGLTLVGAGIWAPSHITDSNADYIPRSVNWVQEAVAEFDPDGDLLVTESGRKLPYDFLFVATGLKLDYTAIDGMSTELIGQKGIASIYAGPQAAQASANVIDQFIEKGGVGLFTRPATEMKCAGAPLKITFLTDDKARIKGRRDAIQMVYNAHNDTVFSVVPVNEKVRTLFAERDIGVNYGHVLRSVDAGARKAVFATAKGDVALDYDLLHVVPPMRAPDAVRNSPLPWRQGALSADGWVEADRATLRHPRYANVFSVGDVAGVPRGKTAASVKWQVPVVVDNLIAELNGKEPHASYNGYTSCPMVTRYGKAMLIEFDYDGTLVRSFPFIDPLEELWISWLIDEKGLIGAYRAMLRGRA